MEPDPFFKKTIGFALHGQRMQFRVAHDLFSSHDVDAGTRLLLRTLAEPEHRSRLRVLDLGCGYGPIGLSLKALNRDRVVHMLDRDALAVHYSRANAALNGFDDVTVHGGLGYPAVRSLRFNLVASNLPAKVGPRALESFLLGVAPHLETGGLVAVVVVAPLEAMVTELLERHPGPDIVLRRSSRGHTVLHYTFGDRAREPWLSSIPEAYERERVTLRWHGISFLAHTAYSLPEFNSFGFATELAAEALFEMRRSAVSTLVVLQPGQGHLAVLAWKLFAPRELRLVDRDLLALAYTRDNLLRNGCPGDRVTTFHQALLAGGEGTDADLVVSVLPEKAPVEAATLNLQMAALRMAPSGRAVVAGSSTAVTRCLALLAAAGIPLNELSRRRRRGHSVVTLVHGRTAAPPAGVTTERSIRDPRREPPPAPDPFPPLLSELKSGL